MQTLCRPQTRRVAVVGGNRIPFARSNTVYATASNQDMLTAAIDGLVARYGLQGERLGEVVAGAVLKHSRDFNLTRESVLGSRLAPETPAYDIQQACDTGIQAAIAGRQQDRARPDRGRHRRRHRHHLRRPDRGQREAPQDPARGQPRQDACRAGWPRWPRSARSTSRRRSRRTASRAPGCRWASPPRSPRSSGRSAARSRTSSPSPRTSNLAAAYDRGFLDDLVTPFQGLERDQNLRADSSVEKLATLKPVFGKGEAATMTAAQLDAADRRRLGGAALLGGVRRGARLGACWPTSPPTRPPPSTTCTAARGC